MFRRVKRYRQDDGGKDRCRERHQEQPSEIDDARVVERIADELRSEDIGHQRTQPQDHQIEQALGAGAHVARKEFVDENVDRRKKERVGDPVQQVDEDDELLVLGEEREHGEARRVAENPDDHRGTPTELL